MINTIINEDAIIALKTIQNNSIDMILTSPPYDNLRKYNNSDNKLNWNMEIFQRIANELTRILKPGGVIVWIVGDAVINGGESGSSFKQALYFKEKCNLKLFDTMIYQKTGFSTPSSNRYHQVFEYMFIFSKGKPKTFNSINDRYNKYFNVKSYGKHTQREKDDTLLLKSNERRIISKTIYGKRFNIWKISAGNYVSTTDKIAFNHPAIFPEKLAYSHIYTWSNPNDIVLDPFAGSGTTLKTAKILNRKYIGIEINKKYISIINERLKIADNILNDKKKLSKIINSFNPNKDDLKIQLKKEIKQLEDILKRL